MAQPYGYGYGYHGGNRGGYRGGYPAYTRPPKRGRGCGCLVAALLVVAAAVLAVVLVRPAGFLPEMPDWLTELLPGTAENEGALPQESHDSLDDRFAGCYVYTMLNADDQEKYRIMFDALEKREQRVFPYDGPEDLSRIRDYILADHPELFYVKGVSAETSTTTLLLSTSKETRIEGIYRYDEAEAARLQQQLDERVASILAGIPPDADDYAKAKYLYEYLVDNVEYDRVAYVAAVSDPANDVGQTIVDALVNGSALCAGYANAFSYLASELGLSCVYVTGTARGDAHAWNAVQLDGEYYSVDVTWGDPQFVEENGNTADIGRINYDYLCVTTDDLLIDHRADPGAIVPPCTSTADNYYVREGLLLDAADVGWAGELIQQGWQAGEPSVQMRCTTTEVFDQLRQALFDEGAVYDYLPGNSCWYTTNDAFRSITIIF